MRFSSFSSGSPTALTPPREGPSLGQPEPHGWRGVLLSGETACTLMGGTGECPLGKRERGLPEPPWRYVRPTWRGITRLTLGGFPAPRPGEGRFSSGKLPGGLALPRTGDSSAGGVPDVSLVFPTVGEPPMGRSSETWPWEGKKQKTKKKENENSVGQNNLFQSAVLE